MNPPFLAMQRTAAATDRSLSWSVAASAHAARWASGVGPQPAIDEPLEPRVCRALARRHGRIPASWCASSPASFGGGLVAAVIDDLAFQRFFAPLFGAGLYGLPRKERTPALERVPSGFRARVRREFEVIRSRGVRPDIASTESLFEPGSDTSLRGWVGDRVSRTLGAPFANELVVLCGGWSSNWRVPRAETQEPTELVRTWLSLFEEEA